MNQIIADVLNASAVIGGLGLLFGVGLGYAGKKFAVEEDAVTVAIRGVLPGVNCGGCGFAGCDQLAAAIAKGSAPVNACPVGGSKCATGIADVMGVDTIETTPVTAFVKCAGDTSKAVYRYEYAGLDDCVTVSSLLSGGGAKSCKYGCLGLGSCAVACRFGAIQINDGVASVDSDKCVACGECVRTCPKHLIEIVPMDKEVRVACNSLDNGKVVRGNCSAGCISCKLCEKACPYGAIAVQDMLSRVDYDKCVKCGACVEKCPTKVIKHMII